ncbi:small basic family protein [Heliophilum fasciatum]|uniref:Small basic protein n=1 Tax=Heliophilum fasciatum TaxID=35700 RepID=A0A4V2SX79_9FIRM|nr:small basic family protein [Heliophilum fasciatum]MCW2277648.1 small basic protein [Heliophilum fasciatum]TCP64996.1 small basic protein [Heliophilum fasciatum]
MWLPLIGLIVGLVIGSALSITIPMEYAKYMSVAVLAALDSVFGSLRGYLEDRFDASLLLTGFFTNAFLAALLAYVGDRLGVDLFLAAVFAFGVRIFQNLAVIRRYVFSRIAASKHKPPKPVESSLPEAPKQV